MKFRVRHYTEYSYEDTVTLCYNRLCLTPLNTPFQECLSSEINVVPAPEEITYRTDFFGNNMALFSVNQQHKKLRINCSSLIFLHPGLVSTTTPGYNIKEALEILKTNATHLESVEYTLPSSYVSYSDAARTFAAEVLQENYSLWDACIGLMQKINKELIFKPGFTTVNTPVDEVLHHKKGVCQDFAHLMITCLRNIGIPARYVSGYIETVPPPGKEKLVGADASHAWVSVYFPNHGWMEFDPTNSQIPSDRHITVAYGRDYADVTPIKGIVFSSGNQKLTVKVDVERIAE